MSDPVLTVEAPSDDVLIVRLNRPHKRNALSSELKRELAVTARTLEERTDIGAVILAGAGGALVAPVAGWLADRRLTRPTSLVGLAGLSVGFLLADWTVAAGSLIGFTIMAVLIDAAVQLSQITGQKLIFSIDPEARGRINAAYMTVMFVVGALGSVIGSATYEAGGWSASALAGAAIGGIATLGFLLFDRGASAPR